MTEDNKMPDVVMATKDLSFYAYDERIHADNDGSLTVYLRTDHPVLEGMAEALRDLRAMVERQTDFNDDGDGNMIVRCLEALAAFENMKKGNG